MSMREPWRGRGGSRHIGRTRIAAAKLLSEFFKFPIEPEDIRLPTGSWRTDHRLDVYRWELFGQTPSGLPFCLGCWAKLGDVIKYGKNGFTLDDGYGNEVTPENVHRASGIDIKSV